MSQMNSSYDADIDSFLNLDQTDYPSSSSSVNVTPALPHPIPSTSSTAHFASSASQQTYAGPSFQYDAYRQQTGLPIGGLANTFAVNQATGLQYREDYGGFVMPTETLNIPLSKLDDFDFARNASVDMTDLEFDGESPQSYMPNIYYPGINTFNRQLFTPGPNQSSSSSTSHRIYPGMHTQQAALAKAQQVQKQQEMMRQQKQQQPQQTLPGQRTLPSQSKTPSTKDPLVEESISRILDQMRQNSAAAISAEDGDDDDDDDGMSNMPRTKKEEEEMDDDERLLASEEGKKLSSKERRQLRNKVSARAFRSRRKEYIGQLEAEVAARSRESSDLRTQNQQLMEENKRLTDLTRMLLSSQSFSGFLKELSQSGLPAAPAQAAVQPQTSQKDVNPNDIARRLQNHHNQVGMALLPDNQIDMSRFDRTATWNSSLPSNDFQVFAVTRLPETPVVDLSALSLKSCPPTSTPTKKTTSTPTISEVPSWVKKSSAPASEKPMVIEVSSDDSKFDLYTEEQQFVSAVPRADQLRIIPTHHKSESSLFKLVIIPNPGTTENNLSCLLDMCSELDATCSRLVSLAPHVYLN